MAMAGATQTTTPLTAADHVRAMSDYRRAAEAHRLDRSQMV
jgi:hypothetical protein